MKSIKHGKGSVKGKDQKKKNRLKGKGRKNTAQTAERW